MCAHSQNATSNHLPLKNAHNLNIPPEVRLRDNTHQEMQHDSLCIQCAWAGEHWPVSHCIITHSLT